MHVAWKVGKGGKAVASYESNGILLHSHSSFWELKLACSEEGMLYFHNSYLGLSSYIRMYFGLDSYIAFFDYYFIRYIDFGPYLGLGLDNKFVL